MIQPRLKFRSLEPLCHNDVKLTTLTNHKNGLQTFLQTNLAINPFAFQHIRYFIHYCTPFLEYLGYFQRNFMDHHLWHQVPQFAHH